MDPDPHHSRKRSIRIRIKGKSRIKIRIKMLSVNSSSLVVFFLLGLVFGSGIHYSLFCQKKAGFRSAKWKVWSGSALFKVKSWIQKPEETQTNIRLASNLFGAPNSWLGGHEFVSTMWTRSAHYITTPSKRWAGISQHSALVKLATPPTRMLPTKAIPLPDTQREERQKTAVFRIHENFGVDPDPWLHASD
jgi:hypothetical protein